MLTQLKYQLSQHQERLAQDKLYQTQLINSLDDEIQNKENTLGEYQRNKKNLSLLLAKLAQETPEQNIRPFKNMRRKLPYPVKVRRKFLQKMHQGVTFFADEGKIVASVYPGKIVFSDWLKGYGLLLILNHGQGFMTLYAHNQSIFKQKGDTVEQGEPIAAVGHTGGLKQNGLYFEVRHHGKAMPPLDWLS